MAKRVVALFALSLLLLAGCAGDAAGSGVNVGQRLPDVELTYLDGSTGSLADWAGRPLVINFWATWCAPCRAEMPELIAAYQTHQGDDLAVLGLNFQETPEEAAAFVEELGISFPIVLDRRGQLGEFFQVRGLPTTLFVDRDGEVKVRWAGLLTKEILDEQLAKILN